MEAANEIVQHTDETGQKVQRVFENFLKSFSIDEFAHEDPLVRDDAAADEPFLFYMDRIDEMRESDRATLYVDFAHVLAFQQVLAEFIESEYNRFEPYLRQALLAVIAEKYPEFVANEDNTEKPFWISFYNVGAVYKIRQLRTNKIGQLCAISGTVTRTSEVRPELLYGTFQCVDCSNTVHNVAQHFRYTEPVKCSNPNCVNTNRWTLVVPSSKFVDWQRVRVQENPDEIPSGAMPRSLEIVLRHEQVERAKAGDKCTFTGQLIVLPDVSKFSTMSSARVRGGRDGGARDGGGGGKANRDVGGGVSGVKNLGVREMTYRMCFVACMVQSSNSHFSAAAHDDGDVTDEQLAQMLTPEERDEVYRMKHEPDLYNKLVASIAPRVFGHEEIKRGVLLMLFGGVHKCTPEGIHLRGDINVCIVGDPSTSKSQFLKYTNEFVQRSVYTSGKSSTAAGLTASVVRDEDTGEFNIEAGALMLADNGICCIDEFDKMDLKDQVAIHEAMEQQTISITKAGIQATLNARTAILAAANPIAGRYDRSRTLKANLQIGAALMSRFDLFFVVLDECNESLDYQIARHIINIHQARAQPVQPPFSKEQLQRYVRFARSIRPVFSRESEALLVSHYQRLRRADVVGGGKTAYRITVRQLESMIRLAEALTRVHLEDVVQPRYVNEAARLLQKSIIHVEADDVQLMGTDEVVGGGGGGGGDGGGNGGGGGDDGGDNGGAGGKRARPPRADRAADGNDDASSGSEFLRESVADLFARKQAEKAKESNAAAASASTSARGAKRLRSARDGDAGGDGDGNGDEAEHTAAYEANDDEEAAAAADLDELYDDAAAAADARAAAAADAADDALRGESASEDELSRSGAPRAAKRAKRAPKPTVQMSIKFSEYTQIAHGVVARLRLTADVEERGMTQAALVNWHLAQVRRDVANEAALRDTARAFRMIIARMVKDNMLVLLSDADEEDARVYIAQPNFSMD